MRGSQQGGNPDGWGVAYYEGVDVLLLREPAPAAESPMVQFLDRHAPRSELIISHVRRATYGDRKLANTQPFQRVLGGRTHVFAHNGFVPPARMPATSSWLKPQGLRTEGSCSYQTLVATLPLPKHKWEPLQAGEIACFERGQRIR